jgi:hypothetical protein
VDVPVVWHGLVSPRPVGTCRFSEASLRPLCPGSRKTVMPVMFGAADAVGAPTTRRAAPTKATDRAATDGKGEIPEPRGMASG